MDVQGELLKKKSLWSLKMAPVRGPLKRADIDPTERKKEQINGSEVFCSLAKLSFSTQQGFKVHIVYVPLTIVLFAGWLT